ncbi:Cytochrome c-type biogenesis protein CcmG/DsbE, thiol:disulfide oxidoreductase [Bathymodiolus thermophilus thioautotrophic gill symbiont]|uniref:Cytochrome c-type biogenesis protein CcmG/DsbE, thiol:disulfide oxidoreductase n=3 Tax=sulfur-oxidizing symbionts TaxID=32036 RepID=A0ACA8ZT09_9GAMM|nr:Cytochrome c-type biogenesis protein CcmG/DsbE, thiol:disulfide oxidoreductase [Bathymodiolus thermophilus thioautotrophic gill symbiont]CAB5507239.1 Cytochrome c-type biogenesis protein CcmG/DsbE, thiol:disulfide oxidoreductase [Bathymodiolus azoricus thioautotrophic gill symbiont]CAC9518143.1 Cytochrome c-type biogenesis protein CcmG/DsbE, thiol:disulfide oxidoreductase [uncultured Gammaproteobacteria bacterium]CAC9519377.1 Cytochrome c-type biogenesis protein CcmG/DsbE, thiol:disulfide oxi
MKKILIILALILPLSVVHAMTLGDLFSKGNTPKNTQLPQFSVVDINGKTHNNNTVKGKYLVVNFWATWCPPCLKEIPAFVDFYEKHSDKVEILGMDYEQADVDKITEFTDSFMVNYPIVLSDDNNRPEFKKFGKIVGMPTTYIYTPDGVLINRYMGEINIKTLEKAIR